MFSDCQTILEVKRRWRRLASQHHPDHGGTSAAFHEVKLAYKQALKRVTAFSKCPFCNGAGVTIKTRGFHSATLSCKKCSGTGKYQRET